MSRRILIFCMFAFLCVSIATAQNTDVVLYRGEGAGHQFGKTVAYIGDVDGDGSDEIAVGAPHRPVAGAPNHGAIYVYSHSRGLLYSKIGAQAGAFFSRAITGLGDVDGDGHADFAVSAPSDIGGVGAVRVFSGNTGSLIYTVVGYFAQLRFGGTLADVGDVNGDGAQEFAVGAPLGTGNAPASGVVFIYNGADGALLNTLPGSNSGDQFGWALDAGDINMDGLDDILIGARADVNNPGRGEVQAYFLPSAPTPSLRTQAQSLPFVYQSSAQDDSLRLSWNPRRRDTEFVATLACDGASPFAAGVYALSLAPADTLVMPGLSIVVAVDPVNLLYLGSLAFNGEGRLTLEQIDRRNPWLAGSSFYLQFFETSPIVRASNGLKVEIAAP